MSDRSLELKVGLFVLTAIAIIGLITLFIGQYRLTKGHGYTLYAEFSDVAGLNPGGSVRIAGVEVGEVDQITLAGEKAKISMTIYPNTVIYRDASIELKTFGALGDKYVMILPGTPASGTLANGDTITNSIAEADLGDVLMSVQKITSSLEDVLGSEEGKKDLKAIVANMKDTTGNLSNITAKLNRGEGTLGKLMNDDTLYTDVKNMANKVNKGEGTLGKLVKDDSLYNESTNTMREAKKAAEGIEEMTPITVLSTIFSLVF